jgi:hypothetical protein
MRRSKKTKEIEGARRYIRKDIELDHIIVLDASTIKYLKNKLEKAWIDCIRCINYGNGKIKTYRISPSGCREWFEAADARIVVRLIKQRLAEINRISAEMPTKPLSRLYNDGHLRTHPVVKIRKQPAQVPRVIQVQRAVKHKQRTKAIRLSRNNLTKQTIPERDELLELELELKERVPHHKGHGEGWISTRRRYWKSINNNWKQHSRRRKQWNIE